MGLTKQKYAAIKLVGGTEYEALLSERRMTRRRSRRKHLETNRQRDREAKNRDYQEDPEKFRKQKRDQYQKNPEKFLEKERLWRLQNPDKAREKDRRDSLSRDREEARKRTRTRRYGVTPEQFETLIERQSGKCAICTDALTERAHIDHCHKTGKVRGLLCGKCNSGLGMFGDDPNRLQSALKYLECVAELKHA